MRESRRRRKLLRRFDRLSRLLRSEMVKRYGEQQTNALLPRVRRGFTELIPHIPDVGGRPPFTLFINSTAMFLAMYRELQKEGYALEEIGELFYSLTERFIRRIPALFKLALSRLMFSRLYIRRAQKRAQQSATFPDGFQFEFIESDGSTFDYGIDYYGCAVVTFLKRQSAMELAPYICRLDIIYSQVFGWGLTRSTTIANGFERCDFRFNRGGPTRVRTDY
jgi:hypothetical protein